MKWLVWALPVLLMVGCSASGSSGAWAGGSGAGDSYGTGAGGSIGSGSGGSSAGCITDVCLATTPPAWDVQIDPPSSSSYAPKQVLANDVPADGQFTVRPLSTISLTFNGAPHGGTVPAKANVVLNVPPLLPGRPDLSYQAAEAMARHMLEANNEDPLAHVAWARISAVGTVPVSSTRPSCTVR